MLSQIPFVFWPLAFLFTVAGTFITSTAKDEDSWRARAGLMAPAAIGLAGGAAGVITLAAKCLASAC